MFQPTANTFQAAAITRSFLVGFRFYRQPVATRSRLLSTMLFEIQEQCFGDIKMVDLHVSNSFKSLTNLAEVHNVEAPATWAAQVLLLASPALYIKNDVIASAAGVTVEDLPELMELVCQQLRTVQHIPNFEKKYLLAAYSGNVLFSTALNEGYGDIAIYDEDALEGASTEIPEFPESNAMWLNALLLRRALQTQAPVAVAAEAPEADTDVEPEDLDA